MAETITASARRKGRKAIQQTAKQLHQLKVDYVDIDSIRPNTYNPNRQADHEFQMLKRSMKEDGFTTPIIVQKESKQ